MVIFIIIIALTAVLSSSICLIYFKDSSSRNPVLRETFLSRDFILDRWVSKIERDF